MWRDVAGSEAVVVVRLVERAEDLQSVEVEEDHLVGGKEDDVTEAYIPSSPLL